MDMTFSIDVPFFGLVLRAEVSGEWSHDTFTPEAVFVERVLDYSNTERGPIDETIELFLPTEHDVSDFYSAHGDAIDEAVQAELAGHADSLFDLFEATRQDEIDNARMQA